MTPHDTAPRLRALRGATTVDATPARPSASARPSWSTTLLERNALAVDDIVSVIFTATADLTADFPGRRGAQRRSRRHAAARAARRYRSAGAVERCVRVLVHCYLPAGRGAHHVYLHGARQLRLDLPE